MIISVFCIASALLLGWGASRLPAGMRRALLLFLAVFLPVSELCKQILLYLSHDRVYQWWYFPFQLCSMPLYLLPVWYLLTGAPIPDEQAGPQSDVGLSAGLQSEVGRPARPRRRKISQALAVFLVDFGLLGGIAVFIDQSGMQYELPILTFHSYLWHFLMIFLAVFLFLSERIPFRMRDFFAPAVLFLSLSAIATGFNVAFHEKGDINMFYISPYHDMGQILFRDLALRIGQTGAKILYILSALLGAFLIHLLLNVLSHCFLTHRHPAGFR